MSSRHRAGANAAKGPVLLDTHVLVWLLSGHERLGPRARQRIEDAAASEAGVWIAAITPWEVAMLVAKGRLSLAQDVGEWIDAALALPGLYLAPLEPAIAVAATRLPGEMHGDPADRLIAATARHRGALLVTADTALLDYAEAGHLNAQRADT